MTTRPSHAVQLINQLNLVNGKSISPSILTVGKPQPNTTGLYGEIMVEIAVVPGNKQYVGSQFPAYDRFDLEQLFLTIGVTELEFTGHNITSARPLVAHLSEKYNWDIVPEDVIDTPISLEDDMDIFELTADPDSLFYRGKITVIYTNDPGIPLSDVILVTQLSGFVPPTVADLIQE